MTYQNNLNMLERVVNLAEFLCRAVPTIDQYCLVTRQQKIRRLRPSSLRRWPSTCAQRNETRLPHRRCRGEQKTRERHCDSQHRSEARRVGKECVSTCSSRWSADH